MQCERCTEDRPVEWFVQSTDLCKECRRDIRLDTTYEMDLGEYEWILMLQGDGCAMCGSTGSHWRREHGVRTRKPLVVDHDHAIAKRWGKSASVRGVLCDFCNGAVARVDDGWEPARGEVAHYLEKYARNLETYVMVNVVLRVRDELTGTMSVAGD